jgi:hypothetical protein
MPVDITATKRTGGPYLITTRSLTSCSPSYPQWRAYHDAPPPAGALPPPHHRQPPPRVHPTHPHRRVEAPPPPPQAQEGPLRLRCPRVSVPSLTRGQSWVAAARVLTYHVKYMHRGVVARQASDQAHQIHVRAQRSDVCFPPPPLPLLPFITCVGRGLGRRVGRAEGLCDACSSDEVGRDEGRTGRLGLTRVGMGVGRRVGAAEGAAVGACACV